MAVETYIEALVSLCSFATRVLQQPNANPLEVTAAITAVETAGRGIDMLLRSDKLPDEAAARLRGLRGSAPLS